MNFKPYRPNVAGVFVDKGKVLVGERYDLPGCWQIPQGGIEVGEKAEEAIYREMREELGCDRFSILKKLPDALYYDFPDTLRADITKQYRGQKQIWFLLAWEKKDCIDLSKSDQEFKSVLWSSPKEIYHNIIYWKRDLYFQGFSQLGLL